MEIIYEPHPVSAERKAELRAKGLTIVDVVFKPVEAVESTEVSEVAESESTDSAEPKKRGRPAKE